MAVRKFKPVTPGTRHKIIGTFDEITTNVPEKSLVSVKKSSGGRNNTGKMTVRYIGGGHKRMYRHVDFKRVKDGVAATVKTIEYDPNRTARIALVVYADGEKSYILAPNGLRSPDRHERRRCRSRSRKYALPERDSAGYGHPQHRTLPRSGRAMARSAGSMLSFWHVKASSRYQLPSGETRMVLVTCRATVGVVSNVDHSRRVRVRQVVSVGSAVVPETVVS